MLRNFRLALCQFAGGADKASNISKAESMVQSAVASSAQVVILPECFNSPYSTSSFAAYAETIPGTAVTSPTVHAMQQLAVAHRIYLIAGSIPELSGNAIYNTSIVFSPTGAIIGTHRKVHLFDINVPGKITFFESDVLSPGNSPTVLPTEYCKIGLGICYDIRFPEYAWALAKSEEVGLLAYPGNFNMTTGPKHWELLARARAVDNQIYVAVCSQARDPESGYVAWGHSMLIDPWGMVVSSLDEKEGIALGDVDFDLLKEQRTSIMSRKHKRFDVYGN